jgi:DNA-binding CsgD family transcriptional regulator
LLAGDPAEAVRLIREAEIAKGIWSSTNLPWLRGALVSALIAAGMQMEAESVFADLIQSPHARMFAGDVALARAAVIAGRGNLAEAAADAFSSASSMPDGSRSAVANLFYAAVRYGSPRASRPFLVVTESLSSSRNAQRAHAVAALSGDPHALELAAAQLKDEGFGWFALDAMVGAVNSYRRRSDPFGGARAMERFRALREEFPTLNGPVVKTLGPPELTARESQVSRLAASGHSDKSIAVILHLSRRTVESHLAHVYSKLGLAGRDDLARVLESP